jgi:hypothetical protein
MLSDIINPSSLCSQKRAAECVPTCTLPCVPVHIRAKRAQTARNKLEKQIDVHCERMSSNSFCNGSSAITGSGSGSGCRWDNYKTLRSSLVPCPSIRASFDTHWSSVEIPIEHHEIAQHARMLAITRDAKTATTH